MILDLKLSSSWLSPGGDCLVNSNRTGTGASSFMHGCTGGRMRKTIGIHGPYFSEDLLIEILGFVPSKSLLRFRCVCRTWLKLIDSPDFVRVHNSKAHLRSNKTIQIFLRFVDDKKPVHQCPNPLSSESDFLFPPFDDSSAICRQIYVLEIENGKGKLEVLHRFRSPCNMLGSSGGLILLRMNEYNCLVVMNPLTRKHVWLSLGTRPCHKLPYAYGYLRSESYALTYVPSTGQHKLVHLFRDEAGYIRCETLNLGTSSSWEPVVGWPLFSMCDRCGVFRNPVEAIGAVHWVELINDYAFVSFGSENNMFYETELPKFVQGQSLCRVLEMDGCLGCVAERGLGQIEIWTLKGLSGASWMKYCSFESDMLGNCISFVRDTREMFCVAIINWEVEPQAFNFELKQLKKLEIQGEDEDNLNINTLAPDCSGLRFNKYWSYTDSLVDVFTV